MSSGKSDVLLPLLSFLDGRTSGTFSLFTWMLWLCLICINEITCSIVCWDFLFSHTIYKYMDIYTYMHIVDIEMSKSVENFSKFIWAKTVKNARSKIWSELCNSFYAFKIKEGTWGRSHGGGDHRIVNRIMWSLLRVVTLKKRNLRVG